MSAAHILVVDDEPDIRDLVRDILEDEGYEVSLAEGAEAARRARRSRRPDLTLLDIWMPDTDGITLLKEWSEDEGPGTPVIMMSGHGTVETAVEATRLGAYDFIEKPLSMAKLLVTVERALEAARLKHENLGLQRSASPLAEPVGRSAALRALREQVRRAAPHDTAVLMSGESGSGKQTFARYLHRHSHRAAGPFVLFRVTAGDDDEAMNTLFGNEEGAAIHYGALEQANGGTLYIDDVADMSAALQSRMLSAIQYRRFLRVGGHDQVDVNVRIVAATHHDLAQRVASGEFREDLYYHLNVLPITVPPLREHHEDVPELLEFYVNQFVERDNLKYRHFSVAAQNRLRNYAWPGNVRELINLVQRLLILGGEDEIGQDEVEQTLGTQVIAAAKPGVLPGFDLPLREARELFERTYLEHQLDMANGNVSQVAKTVGMERTHLYRKLRALGIAPRRK